MISSVDPAVGQYGGVISYLICCLVLPLFDTCIYVQGEKETWHLCTVSGPKVDNTTGNLRHAGNSFCSTPLHLAARHIQHNHAILSGQVDHAIGIDHLV